MEITEFILLKITVIEYIKNKASVIDQRIIQFKRICVKSETKLSEYDDKK